MNAIVAPGYRARGTMVEGILMCEGVGEWMGVG
jgi:hypothetical protein